MSSLHTKDHLRKQQAEGNKAHHQPQSAHLRTGDTVLRTENTRCLRGVNTANLQTEDAVLLQTDEAEVMVILRREKLFCHTKVPHVEEDLAPTLTLTGHSARLQGYVAGKQSRSLNR